MEWKRQRKTLTNEVRRLIWQTHMPPGSKDGTCPICNEIPIQSASTKAGFEAAHIIAYKFNTFDTSVLYLYPSCKTCNNACEDECLLDYMWSHHKYENLRRLMQSVYNAYMAMNPDLTGEEVLLWRVMERLYGYDRWKAGGGIVNEIPIYTLARSEHMRMLNERIQTQTRLLERYAAEMRLVAEAQIRVARPRYS